MLQRQEMEIPRFYMVTDLTDSDDPSFPTMELRIHDHEVRRNVHAEADAYVIAAVRTLFVATGVLGQSIYRLGIERIRQDYPHINPSISIRR